MISLPSHVGADLKINLETDHIILHGSPDEAAGVILHGSVVLNCHEHIKVKGFSLKFSGIIHVHWVEGSSSQRHYKEKKVIMEQEWQFLPRHKIHHYDKGEHHYDFELALPGHLPATFHHDIGMLVYEFKAQVDRPTFMTNYSATRELRLVRTPQLNSALLQQSQEIDNVWANKLAYHIHVPSQVYWTDASIPVTFRLTPLMDHLHIKSIHMVLKEYTRFHADGHRSVERKDLNTLCDLHFFHGAIVDTDHHARQSWSKTEIIKVPVNQPYNHNNNKHHHHHHPVDLVHPDNQGDFIQTSHKLKVVVSLLNPDGHVSELRVSIPIVIIEMVPEEDISVLPAYEDAWRTAPYFPPNDLTSVESSSSSLSSSSSNNTNRHSCAMSTAFSLQEDDSYEQQELDPLPWMGVDLTRVPSYTTALRTGRLYSYSGHSLPSYDSLTLPIATGTAI
ncbi:uncharacterized protein BX664DRAFT_336253 [Halteromyces radiatus]|uniref:uncharacterized protein n=1 Tax=Halteromyces radiatus TaxID=101107 RepID=UPI00221E40BA|nr:uncharacterized protein BX664DRAFT_336253 [Halteromyces radiatus]KAI8086592.1 hypothetical protein BX664DRAFT_336253 [Halteromyces radiatus]